MIKSVLSNRILLKPIAKDATTTSGLILIEDEPKEEFRGTVTHVGCKIQEDISVGDTVIYEDYTGKSVIDPEDGIEYIMVLERNLVAVEV